MHKANVRSSVVVGIALVAAILGGLAYANHGTASGQSFTFLSPGFTQEITGVSSHFMGGVAFAPDGDLWVNDCQGSGSHLHRYDIQGVAPPVNGTNLHPETIVASNAGCGMTNHQDGFIYSNTSLGAVQINASTGAATGNVFGPPGNALGITPDPQTGDVVYVAANCRFTSTCNIITVDPDNGISSVFVSLPGFQFVDGIYFNTSGSQLFLAKRSPTFAVTVIDRTSPGARTGVFNRDIPLAVEPDGIAFHSTGFVATNNTNGTLNKITLLPDTVSLFASGGFRGDLSQVGSDTCLYLTQAGTRYDNGALSSQNSLVRVCPGFVPPPGVSQVKIDLKPGSNPNCVNPRSSGTVAVAIFGSANFNVADINQSTVKFGGAQALRCNFEDARMEGPTGVFSTDGITDLVCHFETRQVAWPSAGSNCGQVTLTGQLNNGTPFQAGDTACLSGETNCNASTPIPVP